MKREILTRGGSASSSSSSENEWAALSYQTHCAAGNASLSSTPNKALQYLSLFTVVCVWDNRCESSRKQAKHCLFTAGWESNNAKTTTLFSYMFHKASLGGGIHVFAVTWSVHL